MRAKSGRSAHRGRERRRAQSEWSRLTTVLTIQILKPEILKPVVSNSNHTPGQGKRVHLRDLPSRLGRWVSLECRTFAPIEHESSP